MKLLTGEDRQQIEAAIRKAESATSGEIVFAPAEASSHYHHATLQGALVGMAAATAIQLLMPVPHTVVAVLWTEFLSFGVFSALLPRLPWRRWFIAGAEMEARVQEAAFMEFYSRGLHKTREFNGVLIYLSFLERRVVILGDRGIHEKIGNQWNDVRDQIIRGIKNGKAREGICAAVETCGRALEQYFPPKPDDVNELSNRVIDRPLGPEAP